MNIQCSCLTGCNELVTLRLSWLVVGQRVKISSYRININRQSDQTRLYIASSIRYLFIFVLLGAGDGIGRREEGGGGEGGGGGSVTNSASSNI